MEPRQTWAFGRARFRSDLCGCTALVLCITLICGSLHSDWLVVPACPTLSLDYIIGVISLVIFLTANFKSIVAPFYNSNNIAEIAFFVKENYPGPMLFGLVILMFEFPRLKAGLNKDFKPAHPCIICSYK
jgi:hypothetical protein